MTSLVPVQISMNQGLTISPLHPTDPFFGSWLDTVLKCLLKQHTSKLTSFTDEVQQLYLLAQYFNGFVDAQILIYNTIAKAFEMSRYLPGAIEAYEKILVLRHNDYETIMALARTHGLEAHKDEFVKYAFLSVSMNPYNWDWILHITDLLSNGFYTLNREALSILDHVVNQLPNAKVGTGAEVYNIQKIYKFRGILKEKIGDKVGMCADCLNMIAIGFGGKTLPTLIDELLLSLGYINFSISNYPTVMLIPEYVTSTLPVILFPNSNGIIPGHNGLTLGDMVYAKMEIINALRILALEFELDPQMIQSQLWSASPLRSITLLMLYIAIAINPSAQLCLQMAKVLVHVQDIIIVNQQTFDGAELAIEYLKLGLIYDKENVEIHSHMGDIFYQQRNFVEMFNCYDHVRRIDPQFEYKDGARIRLRIAEGYSYLGDLARMSNDLKSAVSHYHTAYMFADYKNNACLDHPRFLTTLTHNLNHICNWKGRGGIGVHWTDILGNYRTETVPSLNIGFMRMVSKAVNKEIKDGENYGKGVIKNSGGIIHLLRNWCSSLNENDKTFLYFKTMTTRWANQIPKFKNEGGWIIRTVQHLMRRIQLRWYLDKYGKTYQSPTPLPKIQPDATARSKYQRPLIPVGLQRPTSTCVQPFYTFIYDMTPRQVRLIIHREALCVAYDGCTASWLDSCVHPPPPPPCPKLKIGYVSSDLRNHPMAHLMQSVFSLHDRNIFEVYCYSLVPSDGSPYRVRIEQGVDVFRECSGWNTEQIVSQIVSDGIHILINLNGYTAGERNQIFATRPAPIQVEHMGFASAMGGMWTDYNILDKFVCPESQTGGYKLLQKSTLSDGDLPGEMDPEEDDDWTYPEKILYLPSTYFFNDHKQGFRDDGILNGSPYKDDPNIVWALEEDRRWEMRKALFPNLPDHAVLFANFNQLYKIDPVTFMTWLNILEKVPESYLWLLAFPEEGTKNLQETARKWKGANIADRLIFTEVAGKEQHVLRGRVADLILDTPQVNAHTTACDTLWSGTPMVTLPGPDHKMCGRVAASICLATGLGDKMIVTDYREYEETAIRLANSVSYNFWHGCYAAGLPARNHRSGQGELVELRKQLFLNRDSMRLFDTEKAVRDLEKGFVDAWIRWVDDNEQNIHVS
ncbi:16792_t:CDS:2 [Acaulospora morrowiae]|uniref:protein O-GlcNAc transferase n=1 Tax=Acaulospora morrowiae TaxID=94023 RepID=A0A9N9C445_9GLOM|nr:16792_t:CDS:2 [Acaulospora morrowiae]